MVVLIVMSHVFENYSVLTSKCKIISSHILWQYENTYIQTERSSIRVLLCKQLFTIQQQLLYIHQTKRQILIFSRAFASNKEEKDNSIIYRAMYTCIS